MDKDTHQRHENRIRTAGTTALIVGAVAAAATIIGAMLWKEARGTELPTVAVVAGLGLAYVLGLLGGIERLSRPARRQQQIICDRLERVESAIADEGLVGTLSELAARLDAIEESVGNVPGYGQAVLDGVEMAFKQRVGGDPD